MYKREDFGKAVFWLASTSWVRRMGFVFLAVFISVFYVRHTPQCARLFSFHSVTTATNITYDRKSIEKW
ncbi:transmembrane protein, putative [Medicago truncatula]|uniref:Transmembrane protein, putative n=1 Tax=Medicago truncatula TaxID=3880 RepID=G7ZWT0_MEDTR|nr:transmembrane protein, putative [Medicago truncatula]